MSTKANPDPFDCYAKAEPDEPIFVLLARDKHAAALIWLWAVMREMDGEEAAKVADARKDVTEFIAWASARDIRPVGLSVCVLSGVLEMTRACNAAVKDAKNEPTGIDAFRQYFSALSVEPDPIPPAS